jgi:hypothetical protein
MAPLLLVAMWVVSPVRADDAATRVLAEELLQVMEVEKSSAQMFEMMRGTIEAQIKKTAAASGRKGAGTEAAQQSMAVFELLQQELSWEKMKDRYIELYAGTFSEEEMQGVIAFYRSPAGDAFLKKQPELMRRSMELNQQIMTELSPKLQDLLSGKKLAPATAPAPAAAAAPAAAPAPAPAAVTPPATSAAPAAAIVPEREAPSPSP